MQKNANYQFIRRNKYKKKQLVIMIIILLFMFSFIMIFAKYVTNSINNFFVRSKEFYFFSDKLEENTAVYQIDNWSGVDDYMITINMNSRLNNLKAASYDIGYEVSYTCSDNAICQLSKTEGIIYSSTNSDFFNLTITPNRQLNTGDRVVVEITASSTAKYTKTIRGRFTLVVGKEDLTYQITDSAQSPYLELRVTNTLTYYTVSEAFNTYSIGDKIDIDTYLSLSDTNKNKCYSAIVTISFDPQTVLYDITNENYDRATNIGTTTINGTEYINSITIPIEAISSSIFKFYKNDVSRNYTYPNVNNYSVLTVTSI